MNISNQTETVSGLIDFHSIYFFPTMEVIETRNCLVPDILLNIRKLAECIWKWWNSTVKLWGSCKM